MKLASQEAAQRAREEFGGYAKGVKAVLQCRDEGKLKGIIGTIAELGRVDEEYATALEVAAGARLQSIVTENDMAAAEAIQFLKRNNIGRVRFLPLNKIHSYKPSAHALLISKKDGAIGFAQDLVKFDSRYKDAFGNVFGDTVIMESLNDAREHLGKGRMVTLQGELLEGGGALVGGATPRTGIHFGTSDRDDIDELTASIRKLEAEKLQISAELGELIEEAGQLATARQELESAHAAAFLLSWFSMYSALFLAQIRHTVGYLVIPTRTGLRSAKMSEQQTTRPRTLVVVFPVTSLLVIKWRGTASIRSRVLVDHCWKTLSSLRTLVYECNTP